MKIYKNKNITIDLPVLVDSRMLLCANSGGGKSYAIRKLLEETGNEVMSIILDVEGEFKTLREKFDFLLIGPAGDVPVNIKAAQLLPQKLIELSVSTIIDISDLKMHDRIFYIKKFIEALMELPRKFWKPCLVIVDEAHMYCGQQEKQDSTRAVIDLMTRGRKRGFCGILATQRIAKLHKDAAAEANNYMVGRTGLDVDMKRAAEILGFASKQDMLSLRDLDAGEFYAFGPALTRHVQKVMVAKVKTTHPKVGMDLRGKITPPTEKIKSMLSKLNDLPKEAEEKAKSIKELKHKVRELERELRKKPAPAIDKKQLELAERKGVIEAEKQYKKQLGTYKKKREILIRKLKQIGQLAEIQGIEVDSEPEPLYPKRKVYPEKTITTSPPVTHKNLIEIDSDVKLNRCSRSIFSLLYNNSQRKFDKKMVGIFTGYSHKSGGFNNALSQLNSMGLINRNHNFISLSEQGELQGPELLGSYIDLYETFTVKNWAQKLPKCASAIFQFLMQNPDDEFTKEEIGVNTVPNYQPNSGGFNNAISQLNSLGLIVRGSGTIKLNNKILEL